MTITARTGSAISNGTYFTLGKTGTGDTTTALAAFAKLYTDGTQLTGTKGLVVPNTFQVDDLMIIEVSYFNTTHLKSGTSDIYTDSAFTVPAGFTLMGVAGSSTPNNKVFAFGKFAVTADLTKTFWLAADVAHCVAALTAIPGLNTAQNLAALTITPTTVVQTTNPGASYAGPNITPQQTGQVVYTIVSASSNVAALSPSACTITLDAKLTVLHSSDNSGTSGTSVKGRCLSSGYYNAPNTSAVTLTTTTSPGTCVCEAITFCFELASTTGVIFSQAPTSVDALAVMSPHPQATFQIAGVTDTSFNGPVTLSVTSGIAFILGGATVNAVSGIANWPNLTMVGSGSNIILQADGNSETIVATTPITINQFLILVDALPTGDNTAYQLFIPATYRHTVPNSVLVCWHGSGANIIQPQPVPPNAPVSGTQNGNQLSSGNGIGPFCIAHAADWTDITLWPQWNNNASNGNNVVAGGIDVWKARLTSLGLNWDPLSFYGYGHSEGGWLITEQAARNADAFAAIFISSSWVNSVRMNGFVYKDFHGGVGVIPGWTGNAPSATDQLDMDLSTAYWLSLVGANLPFRLYYATADSQATGLGTNVDTVLHAVQRERLVFDTMPNFDPHQIAGSSHQNVLLINIAADFTNQSDAGFVWLHAQHLSGAFSGGASNFSTSGPYLTRRRFRI